MRIFDQSFDEVAHHRIPDFENFVETYFGIGSYVLKRYYSYFNTANEVVAIVAVFWEGGADEIQRQFSRDNGRWECKNTSKDVGPFGFFSLENEGDIYIFENEKIVEYVIDDLGLQAICLLDGNLGWRRELKKYIEGRNIYIVPSLTVSGTEFAKGVYCALAGNANVKIIHIPELKAGQNIIHWLEEGNDESDLQDVISKFTDDEILPAFFTELPIDVKTLSDKGVPELNWLVDQLIPMEGISMLVSKPKVGKSLLSRFLGSMVSKGGKFLGRKCANGRVVIIDLENHLGEIIRNFELLGDVENQSILISKNRNYSNSLDYINLIANIYRPKLIVIDPMQLFVGLSDSNSYEKTYKELLPYKDMAEKYHLTILFIHHAKKGNEAKGDMFLGSVSLQGIVDTMLMLEENESSTKLSTIQRYGEGVSNLNLSLDFETRVFDLGLSPFEQKKEKVLLFLKQPRTRTEIKEEIHISENTAKKILDSLVLNNKVSVSGEGKSNAPALYKSIDRSDDHTYQ